MKDSSAYQRSELTGWTGHFGDVLGFSLEISFNTYHYRVYYLGIDWPDWKVLFLNSKNFFTATLVYLASVDRTNGKRSW